MDLLIKHKLVAVGIVIVIAAAIWYFMSGSSSQEAVLSVEMPTVPPEAQELIQNLAVLRSVTLDGEIFASASFKALRDFSTPITTEPVGRKNPFAPLSASEMASGSSSPLPSTVPTPRN